MENFNRKNTESLKKFNSGGLTLRFTELFHFVPLKCAPPNVNLKALLLQVNCGAPFISVNSTNIGFKLQLALREPDFAAESIHVQSCLARLIGDKTVLTSHAKLLSLCLFSYFSMTLQRQAFDRFSSKLKMFFLKKIQY